VTKTFTSLAEQREYYRNMPRERPAQIETPGAGQRSVWDFPRPPRVEPVPLMVRVELDGAAIARSDRALRVCETGSPPAYYLPSADIAPGVLIASDRTSFCEWKGVASYWSVRGSTRIAKDAAWSYANPDEGFESIRDYVAFYPQRMSGCWVGDELVSPQPGLYYGGWVTKDLVGPFKGVPGSERW